MSPDIGALASPVADPDAPAERSVFIVWEFPGGRPRTPECGVPRKVGLAPSHSPTGKWCLWDRQQRHHDHGCEGCFDEPGGYADRQATVIETRLTQYFEVRNDVLRRGFARKVARAMERGLRAARPQGELRAVSIPKKTRRLLNLWAARLRRCEGRMRVRRAVHVVVAPPRERWQEVGEKAAYTELRTEAYRQAEERGFEGGVAIFHHKRLRSSRWENNLRRFEPGELDIPVDSPHWHFIGDGWVPERRGCQNGCAPGSRSWIGRDDLTGEWQFCPDWHREEDWVVRNLGTRESVYDTAFYCLTHAGHARRLDPPHSGEAGILSATAGVEAETGFTSGDGGGEPTRVVRAPLKTVTWFGELFPRRFKGPFVAPEPAKCPNCGASYLPGEVVPVAYLGAGPPPKGVLAGNPSDWRAEGITPSLSRYERSERLAWRLAAGKVAFRRFRGLERWEAAAADSAAREAASREEWARVEASVYAPHGQGRRQARKLWSEVLREEAERR